MAWPPPVLPINRTNATQQSNVHPADHNAANLAINDLVAKVTETTRRCGTSCVRNSQQATSPNTLNVIQWLTESVDTDGFIAVPSTTIVIPAGAGGMYAVTASASLVATLTGGYMRFTVGGYTWQSQAGNFGDISLSIAGIALNAGDSLTCSIWMNTSVVINSARIDMYRIAP